MESSLIVTHLGGGQTTADLTLQHFGSILTGSGILTPTSFTVSALSSPGMAVQVSGSSNDDKAVIITDSGDSYFIKNLQDTEVTILANTSSVTKTDAIVLYVDLTAGDPNNAGSPGAAKLIAVRHDEAGVGTGAPTDGEIDAATFNNPWLKLREVTVEHNTGEIEATDLAYEADHALLDAALLSEIPVSKIASEEWVSFDPGWSGVTVGNGTITARYKQVGSVVTAEIFVLAGSSTSFSSAIAFSLPVQAAARYANFNLAQPIGVAVALDASTYYPGLVMASNTTTGGIVRWDSADAALTATFPFTETTGDSIGLTFTYEAAE